MVLLVDNKRLLTKTIKETLLWKLKFMAVLVVKIVKQLK